MAESTHHEWKTTPEDTRAALTRLADGGPHLEARRADGAVVKLALEAWRKAIDRWGRFRYCPSCGDWVSSLFIAEHVTTCFVVPAVARAARAEAELRVHQKLRAGSQDLPRLDFPPAPTPTAIPEYTWRRPPADGSFRIWVVSEYEAEKALDLLAGDSVSRAGEPLREALDMLEHVLAEWTLYHLRGTSRCAWCHRDFDLTALGLHLAECERHPEHDRARTLEQLCRRLRVDDPGIGELVAARDRYREALGRLLLSCDQLDSDMGWADGRYKLRPRDCEQWNEARKTARAVAEGASRQR